MLSGSVGDKATPPYRIFGGSSAVYQPLEFFPWWFWFDAYAPHIFAEDAYIASAGGIAAALIAVAMSVWRPQGGGAIAAPFHTNHEKTDRPFYACLAAGHPAQPVLRRHPADMRGCCDRAGHLDNSRRFAHDHSRPNDRWPHCTPVSNQHCPPCTADQAPCRSSSTRIAGTDMRHLERAVPPRWPTPDEPTKRVIGIAVFMLGLANLEGNGLLLAIGLLFAVLLLTIESAAIWGTVIGAKWWIDLW
jgi:hypothetical protein